jgi:FkbM family methyltransferase
VAINQFLINILQKFGIFITRNPDVAFNSLFIEKIHAQVISQSSGVIHLGGHIGQEAKLYSDYGKRVIWVEGNPETYKELEVNIEKYPNQRAYCFLVGDVNRENVKLNVSSNEGQSSSVFDFSRPGVFRGVTFIGEVRNSMKTLDTFLSESDAISHDHLVIDLQGAELMALRGAQKKLNLFNSMFIEISTEYLYKGGSQYDEIANFLKAHGFYPIWNPNPIIGHSNMLFLKRYRN